MFVPSSILMRTCTQPNDSAFARLPPYGGRMSDSVARGLKALLELVERLKQRQGGRIYVALLLLFAALALVRLQPRPASLPLETMIDGPKPARAAGVLVFLHG